MGGARLHARVQPGARVAGLAGRAADGTLKLKVREPAQEGRANRAACALLADALGIGASRVSVARGAASRRKTFAVEGLTQSQVEDRVAAALAAAVQSGGDEESE